MKPIPFRKMIKGKVIITFLIACTALFLAWSVSNVAFKEMLNTVRGISEPNEKLSVVNNLYRKITLLEQFQRNSPGVASAVTYSRFKKESRLLRHSLDTLSLLYKGDSAQTSRIYTMKNLLQQREKLFADYLLVRDTIVNNKVLDGEVNSLNEMLYDNARLPDSATVLKSENRYTTTVIPARKEETPAGFLRRLFGRRKEAVQDTTPQKIINEELSITIDTIASAQKDTLFRAVDSVLVNLQKKQKEQTNRFINRERQLSNAGHILISQMLSILDQVEQEAVKQTLANQARTNTIIGNSTRQIKVIIGAFFLVTALLLYFILRDITRNNRYRQRLEEANREANYHSMAKQRFLSNMSHEIRTPLQAIMGYAELAKQQQRTGKKNIDAIYNSSAHLLQIVNEVLDYSAIISGKYSFNQSVFGLKKLFEEVVSIMKVQAGQKSISLCLNYELDDDLFVEGDPFRLKQIIYNLLGNALKFTEKGSVTVGVRGKENEGNLYLNIQVEDTGIGISDEDMAHIFSEFERGENTLTQRTAGTGLGLTIVKTLVANQNGRIYASSKPGKGSCFTVYLPFSVAEKPAEEIENSEFIPGKRYPGKVWMVDDDRFILQLCASIFEKNEISYKCFNNPLDLLNEPVDDDLTCVLLDMRMPDMDGIELCRHLRRTLPKGMYIFALTAQALPWEQESVMRQGFDGLLMKPFKEYELLELIAGTGDDVSDDSHDATDLQLVNDMAYGDKQKVSSILNQFTSDTLADIAEIRSTISASALNNTLLILHRIAGRTAQIGSSELAGDFRMAEINLNRTEQFDEEFKYQIDDLLIRLERLCRLISNQIDIKV